MQHINITIEGKVQGVFFRNKTLETATKLGIVGFVRNENDGTVYIEAEGEELYLDEFLKWCQIGSEKAEVENIAVLKAKLKNFDDFRIEY